MARKPTQAAAASAAAKDSEGPTGAPAPADAVTTAGATTAAETHNPAAGDVAREFATSSDTQSEGGQGDPIATPPAAQSAGGVTETDALGDGHGLDHLVGGSLADDTLLGSSFLPAMVDVGHGQEVQLGVIVTGAFNASGLSTEAWNGLAEDVREKLLALMVDLTARSVALKVEYERLLAPPPEGLIAFIGRSADGRPFRRRGIDWTDTFATHLVTPEVAERLAADPHISQPA
jgi:hypothetical protein